MRKTLVSILVMVVFACVATVGFAADQKAQGSTSPAAPAVTAPTTKAEAAKDDVVTGKIVSIDKTKLEITVKDEASQADKVIKVTKAQLKGLKVDEKVKVVLKAGTNEAKEISKAK